MYVSLISGAVAGFSVDVALFPLDTLKTRLQSPQGFIKSGGFKGVYNGISAAAGGSMPGAGLFFCCYETCKPIFFDSIGSTNPALAQMMAATLAETCACLVRVPTEVVKQRMQVGVHKSVLEAVPSIIKVDGISGLYNGYGITIMREIPFSAIQFPLYEKLKVKWAEYKEAPLSPIQAAACGSFSGGFAAGVTTPLDVVKTRLMLGADINGVKYKSAGDVVTRVYTSEGIPTFFSGVQPRVMWISIGGFVFFGAYEGTKSLFMRK
jgi:solute carrier family 25 S-adenosylmethionine transporter 26